MTKTKTYTITFCGCSVVKQLLLSVLLLLKADTYFHKEFFSLYIFIASYFISWMLLLFDLTLSIRYSFVFYKQPDQIK